MEEYEQMIEDLEDRASRLTDWESDFVASLSDRLGSGLGLTDRQIEVLGQIWEKATAKG